MVEKTCHLKLKKSVYLKYAEIWNRTKSILNVKFHSQSIYDDKYMKTEVKTLSNVTNVIQLIHCCQEMKSLKKEFIMFAFQ